MTRRPLTLLACVGTIAALSAVTACSASSPAATVDGVEIPMDTFEADLAAVQAGLGSVNSDPTAPTTSVVTGDGELARNLLEAAIRLEIVRAEIERTGGTISDEDRAAAEAQLAQQQPNWETAPERFRVFFTEYIAAQDAFGRLSAPAADDLAAAYANGITASGLACVSHILVETEEEAQAVLERLDSGEAFADVAADVSIDPSAAASGGALVGQDGAACMTADTFAASFIPEFVDGALAAEVGVPTQPVQSQFGYHVILVRPFEEVSNEVVAAASSSQIQTRLTALLADADVSVNRSIGAWSSPTGEVVALGAATPQQ